MVNPLTVLVVMVSLAALILMGINVYLAVAMAKQRSKTAAIKQNLAALSAAINQKLEESASVALLTSSQSEDLDIFLSNIGRMLDQISQQK